MTIHDATEVAYRNGYEQGKKEGVRDALFALKREIHDKAVYPHSQEVQSFIGLREFDAILQTYINKYYKGDYL